MNRYKALCFTLAIFLPVSLANCKDSKAPKRAFHFDYVASISEVAEGAKKVEIWIPVPQDDDTQKIRNLEIKASGKHRLTTEKVYGNRMVYVTLETPFPEQAEVRVSFDVERREVSKISSLRAARAGNRLLIGTRMAPLNDEVKKRAAEAATGKKEISTVARGLYDKVLADMVYDKSNKGGGHGNVEHACTIGKGNCSDFHTFFVAMARSRNISAFFEIGFPIPTGKSEGSIDGYHCWAWYSDGYFWKPVDISEADKAPEKTEYFFGNICQNRFAMSSGRDLMLEPKQQGEPVNFFIYPYVEVDGKPGGAKIGKFFNFKDLE